MVSEKEFIERFFQETDIPVAPSMERALGYFGVSRWVAFHHSRRLHSLCWADAKFNACRSASTVWNRFLAHPFVAPYLRGIDTVDFEANDDDPDLMPTLPNGEIGMSAIEDPDRFVEASRKLGYAMVLDRIRRTVYITRWSYAFVFLMFYGGLGPAETLHKLLGEYELAERPFQMLRGILLGIPHEIGEEEEDDEEIDEIEILETSDLDDDPLPVDPATEKRFLAWLDRRWNNPAYLYQLALQHCRYGQDSKALEALERALEIRPEHPILNWMTSQVYGSLKRWPEALEACKKSVRLQTTSEKEVPAEVLFMWQGQCYSKLSRYSEAIESYVLVTDLKPDHVDAYHELGWCHFELGHYAEAAAAHEHEIKLRISSNSAADEENQAKLSRAYEELGMAYFFDLRLPDAERAFRQAIGLSPKSLQAHAGLVAVCKQMGNDSEAEREQRLVWELQGTSTAGEQK